MLSRATVAGALACCFALAAAVAQQSWAAVRGRLSTKWATEVDPANAWREYPRPTLRRSSWQCLNGLWDYAILPKDWPRPTKADGRILVPFPLESALSGVARALGSDQRLWYRRKFELAKPQMDRVLLHLEAVDWECEVFVDGVRLGDHRGGYDRCSFDATDALGPGTEHVLLVAVCDPTDAGAQPRGKQVQKPGGIWYTQSSGIWQTVWYEVVPPARLSAVRVTADLAAPALVLAAEVASASAGDRLRVRCDLAAVDAALAAVVVEGAANVPLVLPLPKDQPALLWAPGHPTLLPLHVELLRDGVAIDAVDSYGALRSCTLGKDARGFTRLLLNDQPVFQFGPLDQGFWPDGLYTPPSFAAMCSDLDLIQAMGCNLVRKHVKVEPELFYAECDRRGLLVWQDMPSGDTQKDPASFERELRALLAGRGMHPSIVMWVVFNEGWGQHDTQRYVALVQQLDPRRWVSNASGWTDATCGSVIDLHVYPGPGMLPAEPLRASVLGEFGGLGLPVSGHTWEAKDNWGYVSFADTGALTKAYCERLAELRPLIARGLSAAVYTQTTDVEVEVNGWCTYDRAITKIAVAEAAAAAKTLFEPPGEFLAVVACAEQGPVAWRFTTTAPAAGWELPAFDDAAWANGVGGFGTESTPGARVGTVWNTREIWLRRTVDLPALPPGVLHWVVHHDEDLVVFLDGRKVLERKGYTSSYVAQRVDAAVLPMLTPGKHVLAVQCRQTGGGQYCDLGLSIERVDSSAKPPHGR